MALVDISLDLVSAGIFRILAREIFECTTIDDTWVQTYAHIVENKYGLTWVCSQYNFAPSTDKFQCKRKYAQKNIGTAIIAKNQHTPIGTSARCDSLDPFVIIIDKPGPWLQRVGCKHGRLKCSKTKTTTVGITIKTPKNSLRWTAECKWSLINSTSLLRNTSVILEITNSILDQCCSVDTLDAVRGRRTDICGKPFATNKNFSRWKSKFTGRTEYFGRNAADPELKTYNVACV